MATFKFSENRLDALCKDTDKAHIMNQKDPEKRERLKKAHKKLLQKEVRPVPACPCPLPPLLPIPCMLRGNGAQAEEKKLSQCDGRTLRSGKAKALVADEAPSAVCDCTVDKQRGTFVVDTRYEASFAELTTDIGRKVRKNSGKQNGYDCMPIALATNCVTNPFVGTTSADIRTMITEAIASLVDAKVYGHNLLVKDVLATNKDEDKSWDTIMNEIRGKKWLGKMELDALARVHNIMIMTAQKTGKGTYAVLKFGDFETFGVKVTSAQEIAEHTGPILLNSGNVHWEAIAPPPTASMAAEMSARATKRAATAGTSVSKKRRLAKAEAEGCVRL